MKSHTAALIFGKALLTLDHYSFYYYSHKHGSQIEAEAKALNQNPNCAKLLATHPDILYSSSYDGEITIERQDSPTEGLSLNLITLIDVTGVPEAKLEFINHTSNTLMQARHPNLLRLVERPVLLESVQTLVIKSESPDHISTWKQFCKTRMSLFHTLSIFR